jgi:hypothetical protein
MSLSFANIASGQEIVDDRATAGQTTGDASDLPGRRGAQVRPLHASRPVHGEFQTCEHFLDFVICHRIGITRS